MAADVLQKAIGNAASTTLSSGMTNIDTSAPLVSDTNFSAASGEGMVLIDESTGTEEIAYATTKGGGALTIPLANRGLEGGSAQAHASGATVKGIITAGMWNNLVDAVCLLVNKTTGAIKNVTNFPLTTPQITTSINDANGNEVIKTPATPSAVNEITVTNAATNTAPKVSATGGDTNISLDLITKGSGGIMFNSSAVAGFDGWTPVLTSVGVAVIPTYLSASTITVPSGAANIYQKGDRVRFKQGAGYKYFVITSVADTVLTFAVNTDYTVANAGITDFYYSHQANPLNFPQWFTFAPTWAGFSANPAGTSKYNIIGNIVTYSSYAGNGTSNATSFTMTVPVAIASYYTGAFIGGSQIGVDSGTFGNAFITGGSSTRFDFYKTIALGAWTATGNKGISFTLPMEMA